MKLKSLAFIDNFVESPVIQSVNDYINYKNLPCTYHMPARFGMNSLLGLKKCDAFILLGSASHVTENLPWHQDLLNFIIPKLEAGTPVLGICFGHQLLAHHYGCEVDYHQLAPDGNALMMKEARTIEFTRDAMGFKQNERLTLGFSHSQVIKSLSPDLYSFARSACGDFEAIGHKRYPMWSFQAHPEASEKFLVEDAHCSDPALLQQVLTHGRRVLDQFVLQL